jgi:hypothetical protein
VILPPCHNVVANLSLLVSSVYLANPVGEGIIGDTMIGTAVLDGHHSFHFMPPSSATSSQSTVASTRSYASTSSAAIAPSSTATIVPPLSLLPSAVATNIRGAPKPRPVAAAAVVATTTPTVKNEMGGTEIEDLTVDEAATIASSSTVAVSSGTGGATAPSSGWGERKRAIGTKRKDPPVMMTTDEETAVTTTTAPSSKNDAIMKVEPRAATSNVVAVAATAGGVVEREHKDAPLKRKREETDNGENSNNSNDTSAVAGVVAAVSAAMDPLLDGFARKRQKPLSAAAAAPIDPLISAVKPPSSSSPSSSNNRARSAWTAPSSSSSSSSSSNVPLVPFRSRVKLEDGLAASNDVAPVGVIDASVNMDIARESKGIVATPLVAPLVASAPALATGSQASVSSIAMGGKKTMKAEDISVAGTTELMAELEISHSERERARWLRSLPAGQPAPAISLAARGQQLFDASSPNFKLFRLVSSVHLPCLSFHSVHMQ